MISQWPTLPEVTVERRLPANLAPGDEGLFVHEQAKTFGPVVPETGDWDFADSGLLLVPGTSTVDPRSFQSGFPGGVSGLKVRLKGLVARWISREEAGGFRGGAKVPLVVTDEFSNGYFHWLADSLPKLWWLRDHLTEAVLILPSYSEKYRYMVESLAVWPGLEVQVAEPGRRFVLKGAVVVPPLAPTGNYRPELMAGLAATWREFVGPEKPHRLVFVSRAKAPWRKIRNEADVWSVLEARGFERVFLEDLSFADQVRLLAETKFLVTNHGAGLTNMLFMVPGTEVLEIRLRGDGANNCYFSLASALDLGYRYLLADPAEKKADSHTSDLLVDTAVLADTLDGVHRSKHWTTPLPKGIQ